VALKKKLCGMVPGGVLKDLIIIPKKQKTNNETSSFRFPIISPKKHQSDLKNLRFPQNKNSPPKKIHPYTFLLTI
jgi:hypothetical protein